jgi:hypothetical protein
LWKGDGLIEFPFGPCYLNGGPVRGFGSIDLEPNPFPFRDEVDINAACIIIGSPILEDIPQPRIAVLGLTLEGLPGHEAPVFRLLSKETSDLHISLDDQFSIPFGLDTAIVTLHCTLLPR